MPIDRGKLVVVFAPISKAGHIDFWLEAIILALRRSGFRVAYMAPNFALDKNGDQDIIKVPFNLEEKGRRFNIFIDYWLYEFRELGEKYTKRTAGAFPGNNQHFFKRLQKKILLTLIPTIYRIALLIPAFKNFGSKEDFYIKQFAEKINAAKKFLKVRPDLVINTYLDFYSMDRKEWQKAGKYFKWNWAGIRFAPNQANLDGYMYLDSFRGLWVLTKKNAIDFSIAFPDKKISFLPEVTNQNIMECQPDIIRQVLERAGSRKIIIMVGSIGRRKNIPYWLYLAKNLDSEKWYFLIAGKVMWGQIDSIEKKSIANLIENGNLEILDEYIEDERIINEFIMNSEIIFAVYKKFPHSSNLLSKAAFFKKPIMVSSKSHMGAEVDKYELGFPVSEDNYIEGKLALEGNIDLPHSRADLYLKDNNRESFNSAITELSKDIMGTGV
jgi:hypothetical protein